MSLENKINNLIDKHQGYADNYHRHAERLWNQGHSEQSAKVDQMSHQHEAFAAELRLILK